MSWRWRRSMRSGPFRITFSKKGIGYSVGIPGLRVGRSPTGKKFMSQGIPGTGLYRIKYFGSKRRQTSSASAPTGPAPTLPTPARPSGPSITYRAFSASARGAWVLARGTLALGARLARAATSRTATLIDQLRTRQHAGWSYTPPPLHLPTPNSATTPSSSSSAPTAPPSSSVGTSTLSQPATPSDPPVPPPSDGVDESGQPWWRQKLEP